MVKKSLLIVYLTSSSDDVLQSRHNWREKPQADRRQPKVALVLCTDLLCDLVRTLLCGRHTKLLLLSQDDSYT